MQKERLPPADIFCGSQAKLGVPQWPPAWWSGGGCGLLTPLTCLVPCVLHIPAQGPSFPVLPGFHPFSMEGTLTRRLPKVDKPGSLP